MKAIVVSHALTPHYGGPAVSEASLCAELQRHCRTQVFCRKGALDADFVRGFGLTDVKEVHPRDVLRAWRDSSHWISRALGEADILHVNGHWRWENVLLARLAAKRGIPVILHPRGMLLLELRRVRLKKLFNRFIGNWIVEKAARLIALSEYEITQFAPYRFDPAKVEVIPNGVPAPKQKAAPAIPIAPFFLYFGRLESRKNLLFLVNAFTKYVDDGGPADLVFIGPAQRRYDFEIARRARELGISDRIRILPPVYGPEKTAWLAQAVAVIYPAVGEPYGRVPFETLSAGGMPIVPIESGAAEYLRPFLRDNLFALGSEDALLAAMRGVERLSPEQRAKSLGPARDWVGENLRWDKITARVLAVYAKVIDESKLAGQALDRLEKPLDASALRPVSVLE